MFERVKNFLTRIFVGRKDIDELLRNLKLDLIASDVDIEIAKKIVDEIRRNIKLGTREEILYLLYKTIVKYMGKGEEIKIERTPFKIMLIGLFGSGKTTTAAKLGYFFKKRGYAVCLIQTDKSRPASFEQLEQLGRKIKVKVFDFREAPEKIREIEKKYEVLIIDTSGRDSLNEELINELRDLYEKVLPDKIILVIPAEIGQNARLQIEGFSKSLRIDGIIVTRMDGSAKGGGALTSCYLTKKPVFFIGTGEKIEDLEVFDPERFFARIFGIGDIKGLIERVEEALGEKKKEMEEKIKEGEFDLFFIYNQIEALEKMGPLDKLLQMIPGFGLFSLPKGFNMISEEKLKKFKAILLSLKKRELKNPELIKKRIKEIAYGSGTSEEDVKELLEFYHRLKSLMKMIRRRDFMRMIERFLSLYGK